MGAPKVGKSFLVAQLAYHISTGQPLWDYPVRKSSVLYLALEDDYKRLQDRMFRMFGVDSTEDLHFATCAKQIGNAKKPLADFNAVKLRKKHQLSKEDLKHLGYNIGKFLRLKGPVIATFVKTVFYEPFSNLQIQSINSKLTLRC